MKFRGQSGGLSVKGRGGLPPNSAKKLARIISAKQCLKLSLRVSFLEKLISLGLIYHICITCHKYFQLMLRLSVTVRALILKKMLFLSFKEPKCSSESYFTSIALTV